MHALDGHSRTLWLLSARPESKTMFIFQIRIYKHILVYIYTYICVYPGFLSVVSYLAAPSLRLTHLACALGYSYTAYALALGLSAVIEASYGISTTTRSSSSYGPWALHPAMPLLLIGLPAAVSMVSCTHLPVHLNK
jgi:hypothetical protein